jgi:RecB family exonuclease
MSERRIFLGWNEHCLHGVTKYLFAKYSTDGLWDMSGVVCVTQGARAGRRLIELLAERTEIEKRESAGSSIMIPPKTVTVGHLPEMLYDAPESTASPLEELLARIAALRCSGEVISELLPHVPEQDDLSSWYRVAREIGTLYDDLEGELVEYEQIIEAAKSLGVDDCRRWAALQSIDSSYCEILEKSKISARHDLRLHALSSDLVYDKDLILIAAVDIPKVIRQFIGKAAANVTALVWAPESEKDRFDDLGCVIPECWQDVIIPLINEIEVVNTPLDQANRVVERAKAIAETGSTIEEVLAVALGDEAMGPTIERLLELCNVTARRSAGRDMSTVGPALLLKAVGQYIAQRSPESLAALLRQPDITLFHKKTYPHAHRWIAAFDTISAEYLPSSLDCDWEEIAKSGDIVVGDERKSSGEKFAAQKRASNARMVSCAISQCDHLVADWKGASKTLPEWSAMIAGLLVKVYESRQIDISDPSDAELAGVLSVIGEQLDRQQEISSVVAGGVEMSASDAIRITLEQLRCLSLPEDAEEMAVEVSGWLDAPLDDIPVLVVAGVNEGFLPQSVTADAFLPNRMRSELGMIDNKARFARDAYLLSATSHARRNNLILIAGRKTAEGDPLCPSRLMFACDDHSLVSRALSFYDDQSSPSQSKAFVEHGDTYDLASIPLPIPPDKPIEKISVTAFKAYLACPYRYYLSRIVRLDAPSEDCEEMDPLIFGSLAHDVLQQFAESGFKGCSSETEVREFLQLTLKNTALNKFGDSPLPAVAIQLWQLERRFERFAKVQAGWVAEGWEIVHTEHPLEMNVVVDDFAVTVTGKIDRIDLNSNTGRYRIMDYKTGDNAKNPRITHLQKEKWVDLQLPLYRDMVGSLGIDRTNVDVGYALLPKDADKTAFADPKWTDVEYKEAYSVRDEVLRQIYRGNFWPPSDPPLYPDGLETICMDTYPDRPAVIKKLTEAMPERKPSLTEVPL